MIETKESPIGHVPASWTIKKLKDLTTKIGSGATPRGGEAAYLSERLNFALVRSQCVHDRYFDQSSLSFISDEQAKALKGAQVREGDVFLNITGDGVTFSRSAIVPREALPAAVNQHVAIVRADPDQLHPTFLASYLTHPLIKPYIEGFDAGGSRRAITKGHIESFEVPLPPIEAQRSIGDFLKGFDDKIELNRRMNETLEEMARALFRDWFVDFGPTRRQMEEATDPAAIMGHAFPPEKAAILAPLFPTKLGDDGLPEAWEKRPVGELSDIVGGGTPNTKTKEFWVGGTHLWATPRDLSKLSGVFIGQTERRLSDAGLAKVSSGLSPAGSVLMSSRAPIGYLAIASQPVAVNQGFIVMRPTEEFPTHYAKLWCEANMETIEANANGSTFQEISKKNFKPILVTVPSAEVMAEFAETVGLLFGKIDANEQENQTLAALRDILLPKLMTGEIRISDAEHSL